MKDVEEDVGEVNERSSPQGDALATSGDDEAIADGVSGELEA
jgi:hypothetical protein